MHAIDLRLLDLMQLLHSRMEKEFQVVSGYRSPETNQMLAMQNNGVANKVFTCSKVIDIRLPEFSLASLRKAAIDESRRRWLLSEL